MVEPPGDPSLCRAGPHCHTRTPDEQPGPHAGRGLCLLDEGLTKLAIAHLPVLWRAATALVGKDAGGHGLSSMPTGGKAEAPIPLHAHWDELARRIAWILTTWEEPVREVARLAPTAGAVRAHVAVERAAGTLVQHFSVLLALQPTAYLDYDTQEYAEDDGPGAAVQLATVNHRAAAALGVLRRREARHLPCPAPVLDQGGNWIGGGCGCTDTLGETIGSGVIDCTTCGWWCTPDEYALYATTFVPTGRRVTTAAA